MAARFDECREKGFDAVEADLVDGYARDSGFPLTAALEDEVVNIDQKTGKKKFTYRKADILTKRIAAPAAARSTP